MCPVKLNKQPGKHLQSKVFKKLQQKKDNKKKTRGKNYLYDDSQNVEEEQLPEEISDDKPKRESWLDNLPPVIKPDEELHQELTKKRKEITHQKHVDICKEEANSILNFVFSAIDVQNDPKKITRLKIDFLNGKFIPVVDIPKEEANANKCAINQIKSDLSNIGQLLEPKTIDIKDSLNSLYKVIDYNGQYDANPELNSILQQLQTSMIPYTNPSSLPPPVDFPFVVCVTGPPHSGRTSICQFIHRFFKTFYIDVVITANANNNDDINEEEEKKAEEEEKKEKDTLIIKSSDDKTIVSKISEVLPKVEPNCGLIIRNYPLNKGQAALLEKALNTFGKNKLNEIQHQNSNRPNINSNLSYSSNIETPTPILKTINCLFRTALAAEESQAQIAGRLINIETGEIFHEKFRPPSVLDETENIKPYVPQDLPINVVSYNKLLGLICQLDILSKKGTLIIPIHLLDSTDKLELQIENALRQLYEGSNIPVPFTSFFHFRNLEQLKFAKFCNSVFNYWNDECIPIFGQTLARTYVRTTIIKEKIDYLSQCAKTQFLLNLLQKDKRNSLCDEFMKQKNEDRDYGYFFKEFWNISLMIREHQKSKIDDIINQCGLSTLKGIQNNKEVEIFDSLMKRFFIIEWYFKSFRTIDENSDKINNGIPQMPDLDFDPKDFQSLSKRIGINESLPMIFKKPVNKIVKPEITRVEVCKNSSYFGFTKNRSVSQQKVLPPTFQQKSLHFLKPEKQEQNMTRAQSTMQEKVFQLNSNNNQLDPISLENSESNNNSNENQAFSTSDNASVNNSEITIDYLNRKNSSTPRSNDKEKIDNFLKFLSESLTIRVLRIDANILLSIFRYLTNEIEQIERSIDERIKGLRELMTKWVDAKYSQEMEDFSEKFRKMKKNNDFDGNIFEISLKFKKDDDEECDALIKRLMPYLPSMDSPINFDKDKMIQLLNLVPNDTTVLSMDELLKLAEEVGFSEEELAELEITITMSTIPDFIDIKEFGSSFSKDEL